MSGTKPVASLGPKLLARKGSARPVTQGQIEALAQDLAGNENDAQLIDATRKHQPIELVHSVVTPTKPGVSSRQRKSRSTGPRASFTLRLDPKLHLKLKLASTLEGVSAQRLVTQALVRLLEDMPELETLSAQVKRKSKTA